jgi:predicted house-cleaning noncanonical NTP pyrophosphatase (MazG superfamily)
MLYHNSHVRDYRKHIKNQKMNEAAEVQEKENRTVADILEEVAQRTALIQGFRPNQILVQCDIEGFGTIKHRGGDRVVIGRDWNL